MAIVVTPAEVNAFGRNMLKRLFIETLIHGNTSKKVRSSLICAYRELIGFVQGAIEIQDMLENVLHPRALAEGEKNSIRSLILPPGKSS